ncbi:MAG: FliA/WhiG family RNA polymerase sigma factor [Acidobacteriaceae bacterium]|nr:FliA/WhiG family RNA polymerase sigma factor [Acidobacteriaceae bacterium]MBV9500150.1 FliA/WhiG family RNA polymerase sigma factor [Acidobacteriaceae bacterium]
MYSSTSADKALEEREELILQHLPQVNWIAARIHEKLPPAVELDDLVSAGIVGLLAAIDNFDPSRNASLRTYAEHRIRGAILDSIRGLDGVPAHKRKRLKEVQEAIASAEQKLQRVPTEEEIAHELGITPADYQHWTIDLQGVSLGSLEVIEDGEEVSLLKFISDEAAESPARLFERAELERVIYEGIQKMPENERMVLSLYYKEELNLREIASIMGLHVTRISQLRAQGMLRLRAYMERKWPAGRNAA